MQPGLIVKDLKQNQPLISEKIALLGKRADPRLCFWTLRRQAVQPFSANSPPRRWLMSYRLWLMKSSSSSRP
jgi:hypothetical protein